MYIFLFLPFDKFLSVKIFLVKFFYLTNLFLEIFSTHQNHSKIFLTHKKISDFFSSENDKFFSKNRKKYYREIDRTGASRTVDRKLARPVYAWCVFICPNYLEFFPGSAGCRHHRKSSRQKDKDVFQVRYPAPRNMRANCSIFFGNIQQQIKALDNFRNLTQVFIWFK